MGPGVKVYLYNVSSNTNTELTSNEEARYVLDTGAASPDGFTIGPSYEDGGAPFFSSPYVPNEVYITKGTYSHRLNTESSADETFEFLGWVKN